MEKKVLTSTETAKYLGVSKQTIIMWEKRGILVPTFRVNKYRKYSVDDLEAFLNSRKGNNGN